MGIKMLNVSVYNNENTIVSVFKNRRVLIENIPIT